eukprot:m.387356 g.387356  ORF g.387356 m.387356 type:complete len:265 (-) comp21029_c0_seq2:651-1445(-)
MARNVDFCIATYTGSEFLLFYHRHDPRVRGCYDFAGCHNYKTLSLRFGNMCAAAVYTTVTTLVLSSIVLVSAQSLSAVAQFEHDTRVPSSKVRSGPLKGSQAKPIRSFQLSNSSVPPHRLQAWWTWAKWPAVLCVLPLLAAVPCTMQAFRSVFMIKFRSPQMSQRCAELGWVYNHTTSEGLRIYNHTEAKWDGCYKPMDRSLGADDDPIGVLEEYSQMFIWTAAFTFFTVGFGALWYVHVCLKVSEQLCTARSTVKSVSRTRAL